MQTSARSWGLLVLVLCGAFGAPHALIAADDPRMAVITDVDFRTQRGVIKTLSEDKLNWEGDGGKGLALNDVIRVEWPNRLVASPASMPQVLLANGDTFVLQLASIDEEHLTGTWGRFPTWPALKLPLEHVRGAVLSLPRGEGLQTQAVRRIWEHRAAHDAIVLNLDDSVTGELLGLRDQQFEMKTQVGDVTIDRSSVRLLLFNPELINADEGSGPGALVGLVDGSRFFVQDYSLGKEQFRGTTAAGVDLSFPATALASLRVLGRRVSYLSDLTAAEYTFHPYTGLEWPLEKDHSVLGGALRVRGTTFAKGLGMHGASDVRYDLDGRFQKFQATIGIDDETSGKGSVVFEVLVDGKPAFTSRVLTGRSAAQLIEPIDVREAKMLTLRVNYATQGDIQDHADWCDALLIE